MFIYCIEDINDFKYVGKTKQKLNDRLTGHRNDQYRNHGKCSSMKLHLEHSIIYLLEECEEDLSKDRERYWINKLNTVNIMKLHCDSKLYSKTYRQNNRETKLNSQKKYREKNREVLNKKERERYKLKKDLLN